MGAAANGRLSVLEPLLESSGDLQSRDTAQRTISHLAAESERIETLADILNTISCGYINCRAY